MCCYMTEGPCPLPSSTSNRLTPPAPRAKCTSSQWLQATSFGGGSAVTHSGCLAVELDNSDMIGASSLTVSSDEL